MHQHRQRAPVDLGPDRREERIGQAAAGDVGEHHHADRALLHVRSNSSIARCGYSHGSDVSQRMRSGAIRNSKSARAKPHWRWLCGAQRGVPLYVEAHTDEEIARWRPRGSPATGAAATLQELAKRHLWMHFTRMGAYADARGPDHRPRRRLLRLGRARQPLPRRPLLAVLRRTSATAAPTSRRPAPTRPSELDYFPIWSYAHPPAIELAAKVASLAPGDLNRVFFTTRRQRGGRVGAEARPPATTSSRGNPNKTKVIAREIAYHGTSLGRARRRPASRRCARRSSRSRPAAARAQHERLPPARRAADPSVARRGGRATASCSRARRPSPP